MALVRAVGGEHLCRAHSRSPRRAKRTSLNEATSREPGATMCADLCRAEAAGADYAGILPLHSTKAATPRRRAIRGVDGNDRTDAAKAHAFHALGAVYCQ